MFVDLHPAARARLTPRPPLRLAALLIVVAALAGADPFPRSLHAGAGGPLAIVLDMDPATPGIQDSVTVPQGTPEIAIDVVVQNGESVGAFEFWVAFNVISLEFLGWTEGPYLTSTGRVSTCVPLITENSLRIGCATIGPAPPDGPSGDGVLATLRFRPRFSGQTCLPMLLVEVADITGTPALPIDEAGGCVVVVPSTATPTPTQTPTPTPTNTHTPTRTQTATATVTRTPSAVATGSVTAVASQTAAPSVTAAPSPKSSPSPSVSSSPRATTTASGQPTGAAPSATADACPALPQWSEEPGAWPADSLTLGTRRYSKLELLALLRLPDGGDASVILARELIAAKLAIEAGANDRTVEASVEQADLLLAAFPGSLPYAVEPGGYQATGLAWVTADLRSFNGAACGGVLGAGGPPGGGPAGPLLPRSGVGRWAYEQPQIVIAMAFVILVLVVALVRLTVLDDPRQRRR